MVPSISSTYCARLEVITGFANFSQYAICNSLKHLSFSTFQFMHMFLPLRYIIGSLRAVPKLTHLYILLGTYHSLACSRNLMNVYSVNEYIKKSYLYYFIQ